MVVVVIDARARLATWSSRLARVSRVATRELFRAACNGRQEVALGRRSRAPLRQASQKLARAGGARWTASAAVIRATDSITPPSAGERVRRCSRRDDDDKRADASRSGAAAALEPRGSAE